MHTQKHRRFGRSVRFAWKYPQIITQWYPVGASPPVNVIASAPLRPMQCWFLSDNPELCDFLDLQSLKWQPIVEMVSPHVYLLNGAVLCKACILQYCLVQVPGSEHAPHVNMHAQCWCRNHVVTAIVWFSEGMCIGKSNPRCKLLLPLMRRSDMQVRAPV